MKVKQRQSKIIEIIRKNERASVEELAAKLDISRETIRRDLSDLSNANRVRKIHGGATLPLVIGEGSFQQRMSDNASAKVRVASKAASLFKKGETLFIDTGSTTLYFAESLSDIEGLTIITNSTEIAKTVSQSRIGNQVVLLGGEYGFDNSQTVGAMVTTQIRSFRAHHCVLTVGALDGCSGAMDYNMDEAQIARAMIEQSQSLTILIDASKYDQIASFEVCSLEKVDRLVCDKPPPAPLAGKLKEFGIKVVVPTTNN